LRRLIHAGDEGRHVAPNKLTLSQRVTDWLALKERSLKGRTFGNYSNVLAHHVTKKLGSMRIQKITSLEINKLYAGLTLGPATAQLLHAGLKQCFKSAVKNKLIPSNPVADAEKPAGEAETASPGTSKRRKSMAGESSRQSPRTRSAND
jgi:hypothetical protein